MPIKYQFNFAWKSPYGHVVKLVDQMSIRPGLVVDLGCGYGAVAEPLSERGFKYIGIDVDENALADLSKRGFDSFKLDLQHSIDLEEELANYIGGREVTMVLLLDVLEHLPHTRRFLSSLRIALQAIGQPLLLLTLPNVAHVDVGAKLAFGRFDYTPTGLLDETHVSFFTETRMLNEFRRLGWVELGANDFLLSESDQHFPAGHPALLPHAPLGSLISHLRNQVDGSSHVNQFVRAFALTNARLDSPDEVKTGCFLTVLMRTQGLRNQNLREALTCLAAQTSSDFEVKLLVHAESEKRRTSVQELVDEFHPRFAGRVEVIQVTGGGQRGRPLNVGLDLATSDYVAFLDDDDWVTADWVETFASTADQFAGKIIRSVTMDQQVIRPQDPNVKAEYLIQTGLHPRHAVRFDLPGHLYTNQTPICSFAVPKATIDAFNLRFDESLPVTEDWEFLLRIAQIAGVADTERVTSIYHRWACGEGSSAIVEGIVWDGIRTSILHRLDQSSFILPSNSATALAKLWETAAATVGFQEEIHRLNGKNSDLETELSAVRSEAAAARQEADMAIAVAQTFERSRVWRATLPVRWTLAKARRLISAMKRDR